jgi:hypothetical protein
MNEMHMSKFEVVALETFLIASIGECKFEFILKCRIQKDGCDKPTPLKESRPQD